MAVEDSLTSMLSTINTSFTQLVRAMTEYAQDKGWLLERPPEFDFPAEADLPSYNKNIDLKRDGARLFTPADIVGDGFPQYVAPAEIDWTELYTALDLNEKRVWQSPQMDTLIAKIQDLILGDEAWLTADYQQYVFDNDRDRRLQALDDSLRMLASRHAARGFRIPTSMLTAQENEIVQKHQFDDKNISRELGKAVMEAAKNFQQFGMNQGMSYEQINIGFTQAYNQALLEPIKLKVEVYRQQLSASADVFSNKVKEIMLKFEAEKTSWDVTNTYNDTLIKAEMAPWQIYKAWIDSVAAEAQQENDLFKTKVQADIQALINGYAAVANIAQTGSSITLTTKKGTA